MAMRSLLLLLLAGLAAANMQEDVQSFSLQANTAIRYKGTTLRGYTTSSGATVVEPYVTFNLGGKSSIRRNVFGSGYYFTLPLKVDRKLRLRRRRRSFKVLQLNSFSVKLRPGFTDWCRKTCAKVSVGSMWTTARGPSVIFRCSARPVCKKVFNSLYFRTSDSDLVRSAFKFSFSGKVGGTNYVLTKNGLPVRRAAPMPLRNEFWFEGNKLLLYTIRAGSGISAHDTFLNDRGYRLPADGSWPTVYRSPVLNDLSKAAGTSRRWQMVAEMLKEGKMVAQVVFDVRKNRKALDETNWFAANRLVSSYPYWIGRSGYNFFSVAGDATHKRRFFINNKYHGCARDTGFWVVSDKRDPCRWSNAGWTGRAPVLAYNQVSGSSYQSGRVGYADQFLVYLRYTVPAFSSGLLNPYRNDFEFESGKLLLFTVRAHSNNNVYNVFNNNKKSYAIPRDNSLPSVYRSGFLNNLADAALTTAKSKIVVEMRKGRKVVSQVVFDISKNMKSLSKTNWFTASRVVSSYPFRLGKSGYNFFSIKGHGGHVHRRFFINFNYGGCHNDRGFMTAVDKKDVCPWANSKWNGKGPVLLYSVDKYTPWQRGAVRSADRFLVYMTNKVPAAPHRSRFEFESGKLLLYTVRAHSNKNAYNTFMNRGTYAIPADKSLPTLYRSAYLDHLADAALTTRKSKIVVEMRKANKVVAQVVFDISKNRKSLSKTNWFTASRVVSSKPFGLGRRGYNFFSISGHTGRSWARRFFINFNYGGCHKDAGVLVVMDKRDVCKWGNSHWKGSGPALLYNVNQHVPWERHSTRSADRFLIYMR